MTKQTKTLAMVAVLGGGAYLVYKNMMKQKAAAAPKASYVGKRQRGLTNGVKVSDSGWKSGQEMANKGGNGAPTPFFATRSSKWGGR